MLIDHSGSVLNELNLLVINPVDKTSSIIEIPINIYYEDQNNEILLNEIYGLRYLIDSEYKSYLKIKKIIESAYQINITNYINISSEFKNDISDLYKIDKSLNIHSWIQELLNKNNLLVNIFNAERIKNNLEKNTYSSNMSSDLFSLIDKLKSIMKISYVEMDRDQMLQGTLNGSKIVLFNKQYASKVLTQALKEESITEEQARIEIDNATPISNFGDSFSDKFKTYGLNVSRLNSMNQTYDKSIIYVQSDKPKALAKLKEIMGNIDISYSSSPIPSISDIVVVIGNDKVILD